MKKTICMSLVVFNLLIANNRIELNLGQSYDFAERDIIELIHEHIAKNQDKINARAEKDKEKAKESVKNFKPKGLVPLEPATQDRVFYPPLEYTLQEDIVDANGRVLYKKGYTFNPADYVTLNYAMIVIDATNKREIEWLKKSDYLNSIAYRILLSDGSYYEMMNELQQEVFYLMPEIRKKFQIQKTPSIIKQVENKIEVKEICLSCVKEQNTTKDIQ